jgi:deoxyxylulose-5-phosphate synthase
VGAGLAFACKYNAPADGPMNIAIASFGDGAANQGQIWEAANMASLWKLPLVLMCENNQYGMGTATGRSSSNNSYFTMGNNIPGIKVCIYHTYIHTYKYPLSVFQLRLTLCFCSGEVIFTHEMFQLSSCNFQ